MGNYWNDEDIAILRRGWIDEKKPASQIAAMLGYKFSRNAVIGKARRLKFPAREAAVPPCVTRARREANKAIALKARPPEQSILVRPREKLAMISAPANPPKTLLDLKRSECCYPLGKPREKAEMFCACPTNGTDPYCTYHHAIAHATTRTYYEGMIDDTSMVPLAGGHSVSETLENLSNQKVM